MKITIHDEGLERVTLQIEGSVTGAQVSELHRAYQSLAPSLGSRELSVDLCGVTFVDRTGKRILAKIHSETGAAFRANTPLTKYFAEQAQQDNATFI